MYSLNAIVCINNHGGVGLNGKLLYRIPDDLKRFKQKTSAGDCNVVIMGRKTYESIGRPLPGRINIVLSRKKSTTTNGIIVVHGVEEALSMLKSLKMSYVNDNVFIIGGSEIYKQFEPYIKHLYITRVFDEAKCDTVYNTSGHFNIISSSSVLEYKNIKYRYETYINVLYLWNL